MRFPALHRGWPVIVLDLSGFPPSSPLPSGSRMTAAWWGAVRSVGTRVRVRRVHQLSAHRERHIGVDSPPFSPASPGSARQLSVRRRHNLLRRPGARQSRLAGRTEFGVAAFPGAAPGLLPEVLPGRMVPGRVGVDGGTGGADRRPAAGTRAAPALPGDLLRLPELPRLGPRAAPA